MRAYQQIARDMQVLPNFVAILVTVFRTDLILKWFNCNCILRFWMHTWLMRKFQMNMLAKLRFHDCEKRVSRDIFSQIIDTTSQHKLLAGLLNTNHRQS
ncbi:uncharacterized protein LOC141712971 isoform X2 [Apium graveolens]|uniref:uncharacterized protein LOC141712971 isoform X2 n=1 Tax=Apium graveolens TaxID=4045 RepID=UPI003D7C0D37